MKLSYRDIKYPRLEFRTGELLMILPPGKNPEHLLIKYSGWIKEKEKFIQKSLAESKKKKLCKRSLNDLKTVVKNLIKDYSGELGVSSFRVSFRSMKSKWGSCSNYGNLVFNPDMKYLPKKLIAYIVLHEMAHMISRKHDLKFWQVVRLKFENHRELERELLGYWFKIKVNNKIII
ncbi:MAG: M48 family metallopeptidase [Bacteroidota bacterium]|nr:M48 family metallopeptidase [Bacteroidota bacterium]